MLLWSGQAISSVGSQVSGVAFPLLVLGLTHSPAKAGIVAFAGGLPAPLLALPAGSLADRVNRRHLLIGSNAVRGLTLATIAVALLTSGVPYLLIVAVAFVNGTATVGSYVAERGVMRQLVAPEDLSHAVRATSRESLPRCSPVRRSAVSSTASAASCRSCSTPCPTPHRRRRCS